MTTTLLDSLENDSYSQNGEGECVVYHLLKIKTLLKRKVYMRRISIFLVSVAFICNLGTAVELKKKCTVNKQVIGNLKHQLLQNDVETIFNIRRGCGGGGNPPPPPPPPCGRK